MSWEGLLYLSILGPVMTVSSLAVVAHLGVRYRRELPKLPIKESIEALKLQREEQEARLGAVQDQHAEATEAIREGERVREWLENHRPMIEQSQRDAEQAQEAQRKAESDREKATKALESAQKDLHEGLEGLDDVQQQLSARKIDLAETLARLERAENDLADYKAKREEYEQLNKQLPGLREESRVLGQAAAGLRDEAQSLKDELGPLRVEHAELQGAMAGMREQRDTLSASVQDLRQAFAAAGGVDEEHDPCEDLWVPYFSRRADASGDADEIHRLDGMQHALDSASIRIPKRTLHAFHTALKIQEISPLTLLAGISGTGKSLLPRLYAKCMGMHFLNLPVQPEWSSPQDLFGFYNHIEHRFKATPLARAMVQFDRFNREDWELGEDNPPLDDQVLLVLLDEMNLARVEYYFSELLSRLETRRSLDTTDPGERQKVEIPLEIGHGFRGRSSLSLYPGENVLFTGTMNEDESTMSLSDKVLDRATVLRFGKPAELIRSQPNLSMLDDCRPLAIGSWREWQSRNEVGNEILDALDGLVDVMSLAMSPFGHRVAQGMISYVASYPDVSPQGQRHAFADQIEQKILPKLRGKELASIDDALRKLESLVHDLGDAQLVQAMREGHNEAEGTFMWMGLDRNE